MAKKKTAKKAAKKTAPAMEMLLVGSKVKAVLRAQGVNVGEGTLEALNGMVLWYAKQAALRAKSNGRKTTRPHDVILMEAYE
ncbi:MAG: hypothetical protein JRI23_20035 [Deltaproteobacteria bacterium]|nr:hypothetical protein [Deltaproteobacteria bacterium]MBW2534165.1 hypothetical protein [Deltaproteobacteria bacterium]